MLFSFRENIHLHPDWYGSVRWVSSCKLKGGRFDSWSGYMSGLQARSPVGGVQEATNRCFSHTRMFFSFCFSLPSLLSKKINKIFSRIVKEQDRGRSPSSKQGLSRLKLSRSLKGPLYIHYIPPSRLKLLRELFHGSWTPVFVPLDP